MQQHYQRIHGGSAEMPITPTGTPASYPSEPDELPTPSTPGDDPSIPISLSTGTSPRSSSSPNTVSTTQDVLYEGLRSKLRAMRVERNMKLKDMDDKIDAFARAIQVIEEQ